MSQDLFSVARLPRDDVMNFEPPARFRVSEPEVRLQAREIIASVLASSPEADSEAVKRLRAHVSKHPDEPERALLEHLMESGRINRASQLQH